MNSTPRVTLKQIAEEANLSIAAVSMALRNHPRIGKATCLRVQELAAKHGYMPDPALSALVAYRQNQQTRPIQSTVALVIIRPEHIILAKNEISAGSHGVKQAATKLGYSCDDFHVGLDEAEQARVLRIIKARGIRGIVFQFLDSDPADLKVDWGFVAAVGIGIVGNSKLPLPIVCGDHFRGAVECVQQVAKLGFRRPALLMPASYPAFLQTEILGGYLAGLRVYPTNVVARDLQVDFLQETWRDKIASFIEEQRPDVVISAGRAGALSTWLDSKCPELATKVRVCTLDAVPEDHMIGGMLQDRYGVGVVAMENLHRLILANTTGPFERTQVTYIPAIWREGTSLQPLKTVAKRKAKTPAE